MFDAQRDGHSAIASALTTVEFQSPVSFDEGDARRRSFARCINWNEHANEHINEHTDRGLTSLPRQHTTAATTGTTLLTFLGIDLGTSEVRVLLTDDESQTLATGSARLEVEKLHPHWSEQSPQSWWHATLDAIAQVRASNPARLCGAAQRTQLVGPDAWRDAARSRGRVLRPAILWNDTRAAAECVELEALVPESRSITGNLAMPGFTAPKLLWLSKYEAGRVPRSAQGCCCRKTISRGGSRENSSRTCRMRRARYGSTWRSATGRTECFTPTGLSREHMPRLVEGSDAAAQLNDTLRREWGIANPVLLCGGAGDNAASAIGMGVAEAGSAFLSLGTSGVLFAGTDRFAPNPAQAVHAFCHCLPDRWHQMSVILSAASSLLMVVRRAEDRRRRACGLGRNRRCTRRTAVSAVSERRAHAAQRREREGRVLGTHRRSHERRPLRTA